ncbi:MAG TPA: dihydropyrimidine dehydrogenase, partial [Armatimonadota bacterium]|nr:dihydropyrimidine dehydrogenase [Armatimonadota bacterium]
MANDNKRRLAIPRQHIPTRPVEERIRDYEEVAIGFSEEEARREAERCLQCKHAKCMEGCPVSVHIPAFIKAIAEGRDDDAVSIVREQNLFPA